MSESWKEFAIPDPESESWKEFAIAGPSDAKSEPGWFQPGSKTDAAVRGFSNAATFGFGDEIQAGLRAVGDDTGGKQGYMERLRSILQSERANNEKAAAEQPVSYIGGNIAGAIPQGLSMARGALIGGAGKTGGSALAGQMSGGAQTAAKLSIPNAAGNADTSTPDWASNAVEDMAIQTAVGGAAPLVSALASKAAPAAKYMTNKAFPGTFPKPVESVDDIIAATRQQSAPSIGSVIKNSLSLPATGALAGAGLREFGPPGMMGNNIPWNPDPAAAIVDRGIYAAGGAAIGVGARAGINIAKDVAAKSIPVIQKSFSAAGDMASKGETRPMFKTIDELLHGSVPSKSIGGSGGPTATPGLSPKQQRQEAMENISKPETRAITNKESPVAKQQEPVVDSSPQELEEYFRRIQPKSAAPVDDITEPMTQSKLYQKYQDDLKLVKTPSERNALADKFQAELDILKNTESNTATPAITKWKDSMNKPTNTPMQMADTPKPYRAPGTNSEDESVNEIFKSLKQKPVQDVLNDPEFARNITAYKFFKDKPTMQKTALDKLNEIAQKYGYDDMKAFQAAANKLQPK